MRWAGRYRPIVSRGVPVPTALRRDCMVWLVRIGLTSDLVVDLKLQKGGIEAHWAHLEHELRAELGLRADEFSIISEWTLQRFSAGLMSPFVEMVDRERGGRVRVVPLFPEEPQKPYWVSWMEEWEVLGTGQRRCRFKASNLTFFLGEPGLLTKAQLFRAEWAGIADWDGRGTLGWQAPGAGHPHWQFDALRYYFGEHLRRERVRNLARLMRSDEVTEFGDDAFTDEVAEFIEPRPEMAWTHTHFKLRPEVFSEVILQGNIRRERGAHRAFEAGWDGYTDCRLNVEIAPAFTPRKRRRDHISMVSEGAGADRRLTRQKRGQDVISILFIGAQQLAKCGSRRPTHSNHISAQLNRRHVKSF